MTITQLDCLQCGANYDYIGGSSHVLECPDCESTCVSPVGKLHIEGSDYWSAPNGTGELQISAVDEHDRHVEFCIGFQRSSGKLTQITIEENSIQAQQCSVVWPLKELFAEQLSEFGITELINPMGTDADNPTQR
jgi:hypothetical protein